MNRLNSEDSLLLLVLVVDTSNDIGVRSLARNVSLVKSRCRILALRPVNPIVCSIGKEVKFALVFTVLILDFLHDQRHKKPILVLALVVMTSVIPLRVVFMDHINKVS